MTKKCLMSFITYMIFSAICIVSMHLMLLADVNKYVGVCIGGGIYAVFFSIFMIFCKGFSELHMPFRVVLIFLPVSAIACGIAISSLYVYLGVAPKIIYSFYVWIAYLILFLVYCLLGKIPFFKRYPRICMAVYGLLVLAGGIVGICLSSTIVFSLALIMFVPFISYLATILARSKNHLEHNTILILASFIGLSIVVIVVLIVISEGEALDGLDGADIAFDGEYKKPKKNPYDFI